MINFVEHTLSDNISSNKIALVTIENHLPYNVIISMDLYIIAI